MCLFYILTHEIIRFNVPNQQRYGAQWTANLLVTNVPLVHVQRLVHKQMDFVPPGRAIVVLIVSDWGTLLVS